LAFASIYSIIILVGILSKSSTFSLVISYMIFFIFSPILSSRETIFAFINNSFWKSIFEILYYIIPQTSDLSTITTSLAVGNSVDSFNPIIFSFVYIILILLGSIFIFRKKDY